MEEAGEDARVADAARNNAELCDAVCRSHGISGAFAPDVWTSARRTPELYPDAVTLRDDARPEQILARIDRCAGASVKDSFATLDLDDDGFHVLFSAEWIWHGPEASDGPGSERARRWSVVTDADDLTAWEEARSDEGTPTGLLRPELLAEPGVVVLRAVVDGEIVAGVILNRSERVVGLSNLFTTVDEPEAVFADARAEAAARFPGLPVVGYESDEMLDAARRAGFRAVGPLRIWVND